MTPGRMVAAFVAVALVGATGPAMAEGAGNEVGWYVSLEGLTLGRSAPANGLIVASNVDSSPYLTGSDFDFGRGKGLEGTIGYRLNDSSSVELRLMSATMDASDSFVTPWNFIGFGFTGPGGALLESDYETDFRSGEINWRHSTSDRFSWLVGLRSLTVDDTLRGVLDANIISGLYEAENSLRGAQVGVELALTDPSSAFQLGLVGKAGVFGNRSNAGIRNFLGPNFIREIQSDRVTETSYAVELGLKAGYQLSRTARVTAGYQAIRLSDLALASNAASESLGSPDLLGDNIYRDDLTLQGFTLGFEFSF